MTGEEFSCGLYSDFECALVAKGDTEAIEKLTSADGGTTCDIEEIDGNVDLGEISSQYLALEINPYPLAPGVVNIPADEAGPPMWQFGDLDDSGNEPGPPVLVKTPKFM